MESFYNARTNNIVNVDICRAAIVEIILNINELVNEKNALYNPCELADGGPDCDCPITVSDEYDIMIGGNINNLLNISKSLDKINNYTEQNEINILKTNLSNIFQSYSSDELDVFNEKCKKFLVILKKQ